MVAVSERVAIHVGVLMGLLAGLGLIGYSTWRAERAAQQREEWALEQERLEREPELPSIGGAQVAWTTGSALTLTGTIATSMVSYPHTINLGDATGPSGLSIVFAGREIAHVSSCGVVRLP